MNTQTGAGQIRIGTPQNLWGVEHPGMGTCWLPGVPGQAFCILYLDQAVNRISALAAIYACDKLGYAEVALLLPDPNRVLARAYDFEAFSSLRGKLRARLVIVTWSPRLALLATWWRFPVAQTVKHYVAHYARPPSPGTRQPCWLVLLFQAFRRYALARWLGRAPDSVASA